MMKYPTFLADWNDDVIFAQRENVEISQKVYRESKKGK